MDRQEADRQSRFRKNLAYFRTISGEGNDSAYSSYGELPGVHKDDNTDHWAAMPLDRFTQNHGDPYINLFRSQLALLVKRGAWDPSKNYLQLASLQACVPKVPGPLYLTPDSDTGMLCCSTQQGQAGPYQPANLNGLEVNYVLYSQDCHFNPQDLNMVLFSPKFQSNYALTIVESSSTENESPPPRVDVKFLPCGSTLPSIRCQPSQRGPYNISITAYGQQYWLYLDVADSRAVVRAYRANLANAPAKAEFNFQNVLLRYSQHV